MILSREEAAVWCVPRSPHSSNHHRPWPVRTPSFNTSRENSFFVNSLAGNAHLKLRFSVHESWVVYRTTGGLWEPRISQYPA